MLVLELLSAVAPLSAPLLLYVINYPFHHILYTLTQIVHTQRKMQKYLLSFVLTGNPNKKWANDKIYWPKYGSNATELVFNSTMYTQGDDLANAKSLYWNEALWY